LKLDDVILMMTHPSRPLHQFSCIIGSGGHPAFTTIII